MGAAELGADFPVRAESFQGPLHLLVHLAERQGLDVRRIRVGQVADAYLSALGERTSLHLEDVGAFLALAARLVRLKALWREGAWEAGDEEEALAQDLAELQRVQAMARHLMERERRLACRPPWAGARREEAHTVDELLRARQRVLRRRPARERMTGPSSRRPVTAWLEELAAALATEGSVALVLAGRPRGEQAGRLLAALHLAQRRVAVLEQEAPFAALTLRLRRE